MPASPEAFFLQVGEGAGHQRYCLFYPTQSAVLLGMVLYIHPFAEEMNKSRRMAALQSRALAQAGYCVLQIDLLGCGDSSGDFGDATWQSWVDDVRQGCQWLRRRCNSLSVNTNGLPLWLWGLRAGCLLAVDAARQMASGCHFVFWQPPTAGKPLLQQFLRLKLAGDVLGGQAKGAMQTLRQQLADGSPVEIAGYMLSPGLASGLEQAVLAPPLGLSQLRRVVWMELSTREDAIFSPVSNQFLTQWQQAGYEVRSHIVQGPAFWQTTEIEDAPALISITAESLFDA